MPKLHPIPHFQPSTEDWPAVRAAWLDFIQGHTPSLKNLDQLASSLKIPTSTLYKKTARWKREELEKLEAATDTTHTLQAALLAHSRQKDHAGLKKTKAGEKRGRKGNGSEGNSTLNATNPLAPSLLYTDQHRNARALATSSIEEAMRALLEEVRQGRGPSRMTAIKELLALGGMVKDTEKKDEAGPHEGEETHVLKARLVELMKDVPHFADLLKRDPTTFEEGPSTLTISTPASRAAKSEEEVPVVSSPVVVLKEDITLQADPAGLKEVEEGVRLGEDELKEEGGPVVMVEE